MPSFTKQAIVDTYIKLLNEKPFSKITIKDIVDKCGVNRNTFYYYFADIYDITNYILIREAEKIISDTRDYQSWQDAVTTAVKFALDNKKAIYHIYNSIGREQLEKYLYSVIESAIIRYIKQKAGLRPIKDEDVKLIAEFYKFAFVGKVLEWIDGGMKYDAEKVVTWAGQIVDSNLENTINLCVKNSDK